MENIEAISPGFKGLLCPDSRASQQSKLRWTPFISLLTGIIRNPKSTENSVKIAIGHLEDLAKKADRIADLIAAGRIEIKDAGTRRYQ
tara:strand:+ start:58 stop:321 length:264 start_codon:yes stop_codon:yes gene_type:complete